ncbi:unnamed protein product [Cunninghamella echinulata]
MEDKRQKENIPPLRFQQIITSPPTSTERHCDSTVNTTNTSPSQNRNQFIPQTFITSTHRRAEPTRSRPTIGGKTISSSMMSKVKTSTTSSVHNNNNKNNNNISILDENNNINNINNHMNNINNNNNISNNNNNNNTNNNNNNNNQHQRMEQKMSTEQLKMLSRRIDPTLPVSPHGSPRKPALPSIFTNKKENERSPKRITTTNSSSASHLSNKNSSLSITYSCQEPHSYSLYQTCIDLWPTEPTLGDFSSDNIKSLTDLLKVRLSQAKYRILAQLEDEEKQELQGKKYKKMYPSISSVASTLLRDDIDYSTWPTFEKHTIELSSKRSNVFACVSGNGHSLFHHRDSYLQRHRHQQRKRFLSHAMDDLGKYSTVSFPPPPPSVHHHSHLHQHQKKDLKRKRRSKSKSTLPPSPTSSSSLATKDIRSQRENEARLQASQIAPVVLDDGTHSFVCTPCNKKYKTRNGLVYHLSRCTYQNTNDTQSSSTTTLTQDTEKEQEQDEVTTTISLNKSSQETAATAEASVQDDSKTSTVFCICDHPNDDNGMMVQCDECQYWLHVGCVGMADAVLDDIYNCPRCINRLMKRPKLASLSSSETTTTVTATNSAITTQDDITTLNNALLLQQLNDTTKSLNFSTLPTTTATSTSGTSLTTIPQSSSSPNSLPLTSSDIKSTQQSAIWDDFDLLDNTNSSNNNNSNESDTTNINNDSNSSNDNNNNNSNMNNMWGLSSDIPSLLYSDANVMTSTLDDDMPSYLMDLPSSELSPHDLQPTDWFQFANFDDDFCEF